MGQLKILLLVAALLAFFFFFLAFLGVSLPGWSACPELVDADGLAGAPAVSAAHAGAAKIKAHSNNSNFFMVILPL